MQDCMGRTMAEQMEEVCGDRRAPELPAPSAVPGDFLVRIGAGWGGQLHELADALATWERGPGAAVGVLLSWLWFVEWEAEGVSEGLVEGMRVLRGAVMVAGVEAAGAGRGEW